MSIEADSTQCHCVVNAMFTAFALASGEEARLKSSRAVAASAKLTHSELEAITNLWRLTSNCLIGKEV